VAKTTEDKTGKFEIDESAIDATELSESAADAIEFTDATVEEATVGDESDFEGDLGLDGAPENGLELEAAEDVFVEPAVERDLEPAEQPIKPAEDPDTTNSMQIPDRPEKKPSGRFVPLFIGGVVAGAIGYGIAIFYPLIDSSGDLRVQLAAQADQIATLEAHIANIPAPDFTSLDAQISDLSDQTVAQLNELSDRFGTQIVAFDDRLADVEKAPDADGTLSETAIAVYQRELDQLRAEITAQQADVMSVAAQAEADLAEARQESAKLEQDAIATAQAASARAALNRVATAVETGAPFGDALAEIGVTDLPAALMDAAENGVATAAQLTQDYPIVARSALTTARAEGLSDDAGGLGGFLRRQFDVRFTSPQEGAGPDAILSRAEAAIKEGRVADALAELDALPDVARAEMTDWIARATQRADVLDAIATLSETYN
jgi:hypothetical protein